MHPAGRVLVGVWATILVLGGGGALLLQVMGPPGMHPVARPVPTLKPILATAIIPAIPLAAAPQPVAVTVALAAPDPALLEPAPDFNGRMLPRIAADGRRPADVYAAHPGLPAHGAVVAVLVEGLGLSDAVSRAAVDDLPAAVSLGFSPYAPAFDQAGQSSLADAARRAGHETLLSLPMEPAGSPLDDEGPQALSTTIDLDQDRRALQWTLSRLQGYVGVTNALSGLRGDRFANAGAFEMVAKALAARGLIYVDAGTGVHTGDAVPVRDRVDADLTIDDQPDAADIEARLSRLEQIALTQGSALGIAGPLRPVTIERLQAWSRHLADRGVTLIPVTALLAWRRADASRVHPVMAHLPIPANPERPL
ncbi:divergent polysaccharide deacetylase family protein [Lichenicola cladoniae]|uniref:Divergent polysaccharide deacetylase family protein n=1 Tax=Lichenicola cladoniae TaxID=1484109 RepID=A0A6M8HMM2_9PROT|nr:divergent polysaccharide deacetylase family protein [Lichenicola cladoniae]NPD67042.1 divergent polysaccharide deacetylase family protein [Acetobacteraceae bacterium]QKE89585.1 divergent polysaccharide deacetylase family protein [Lichenicola cladoniae]